MNTFSIADFQLLTIFQNKNDYYNSFDPKEIIS